MRRTFITPFDRGDIQDLITSMDDAIDQMQKTAKSSCCSRCATSRRRCARWATSIVQLRRAGAGGDAAAQIDQRRRRPRLSDITEEISALEGQADELHDHGLQDAVSAPSRKPTAMAFIIGNEIYDHLEKVVDRFEDVANEIHGIVIEHV